MQPLRNLGGYIREQRSNSQISLRQLAAAAGVSNPYLSQVERGLRKPSAEFLQQIAKALRISAEALYVQAGILEERAGDAEVATAIHADRQLTERQKQVLLEIYESFCKENAAATVPIAAAAAEGVPVDTAARRSPPAAKAAAKSAPKRAAKSRREAQAPKKVPARRTRTTAPPAVASGTTQIEG